ncbi:MAG TPA: PEP-CTERM sorting domain-containing protein [Oligoflexia bacterium]|nr:PEP-CTERM sorting domain-containing protein [Oligoflexia bacterium]HMP49565.1 PEP-CTERM sorting domain-containing protein [Oligoflexia bacterium]
MELIRSIVGDVFYVGIDLQEPDDEYLLEYFNLVIDDKIEFELAQATTLFVQNHGTGFSDYVLLLFDLSAFKGDSKAVFNLVYSDAQAAREQFFLAAAGAPIPEPASMGLLLSGLSAALIRRRKMNRA